MYWSANQPIVKQCVGQHIDWFSADITTYVSQHIDRCINRDIKSDGQHIDRLSADISVNIEADTWPIRWPLIVGGILVDCRGFISQKLGLSVSDVQVICISSFFGQPQKFLKASWHISVNILTDTWPIRRPTLSWYVDWYIGQVSVDMLTDISVEGCTKYTWSVPSIIHGIDNNGRTNQIRRFLTELLKYQTYSKLKEYFVFPWMTC